MQHVALTHTSAAVLTGTTFRAHTLALDCCEKAKETYMKADEDTKIK